MTSQEVESTNDVFDESINLSMPSTIPSNYDMRIETDILEPVVFSSSNLFARFTLQKKGFLSHQSKIAFSMSPNATITESYYPVNVGVNSLIDRVVLKAQNRTIAETASFGMLQAYRSQFLTNENNYEREQYITQRMVAYEPVYSDTVDTNSNAPTYGISTGMNPDGTVVPFQPFQVMNVNRPKENPVYSIFLSDLLDVFSSTDLPMYLIDDEVHIELHFTNPVDKRNFIPSFEARHVPFNIDINECRMIYDTIYYNANAMEKYREKVNREGGIKLDYVDYRLTNRSQTKVEGEGGMSINLGGGGRMVEKVIYGINQGFANVDSELNITNAYYSFAPTITASGSLKATEIAVNLRYNDRFEFPVDRKNLSLLFDTTTKSEGLPMYVSRQFYGNERTSAITTNTLLGRSQKDDLASSFFWNSIKLMRGERISNQGITLDWEYHGENQKLLYVWLALKKTAVIKDGKFDCYFN